MVITQADHLLDEGEYGGFFRRVVAGIIDVLIVATISRKVGLLIFSAEDLRLVAFAGIIWWLYFALMESSKLQATIGKLFVKVKVTDLNNQKLNFVKASIRFFSKLVSMAILGIGFLMVIWTDRKQGLHDLMAKTIVIKK